MLLLSFEFVPLSIFPPFFVNSVIYCVLFTFIHLLQLYVHVILLLFAVYVISNKIIVVRFEFSEQEKFIEFNKNAWNCNNKILFFLLIYYAMVVNKLG